VVHRRRERKSETDTLGFTQRLRLCEGLFGLQAKGFDGFPERQELVFGLPYQRHKDTTLATTAAAKATHYLGEGVL